jgi:hypothetical protein
MLRPYYGKQMTDNIRIGKLVCDLISLNVNEKLKEELKQFDNAQWQQVYSFVKVYNLIPLFYSKMNKFALIELIPKNMLHQLQDAYNSFSCSAIKREYEIKKILKILSDSGVEVILLKGIYLSESFYDNPAERPMSDVDLLVKFSNLDRVTEILKNFGCTQETDLNKEECENFIQHLPAFATPKKNCIEVHWKLTADLKDIFQVKYDLNELWKTKNKIKFYDTGCFVFRREFLLIHLCVHIAEDLFQQKLLQLYDILLILKKNEIDWNLVFEKSEEWNCLKAVCSAIVVVNDIFSLELPQVVKSKLYTVFKNSEEIQDALIFAVFKDLKNISKDSDYTEKLRNKSSYDKLKYAFWTTFDKERLIFWNGKTEVILILYIKRIFWLFRKYTKIFFCKTLFSKREGKAVSKENDINPIRKWFEF